MSAPLAERLRHAPWMTWWGKTTYWAKASRCGLAFESGQPHSMILWGPGWVKPLWLASWPWHLTPISQHLRGTGGVKDRRGGQSRLCWRRKPGVARSSSSMRCIASTKAQQDAFLPHVESGLFTFIGPPPKTPHFEVNAALAFSRDGTCCVQSMTQPWLLFWRRAHGFAGAQS